MIVHVYDERGKVELACIDAQPECGEAFCDSCGDCLVCYGDWDGCACWWVLYVGSDDDEIIGLFL